MTTREIKQEIKTIIDKCDQTDEQQAIKAILLCVLGSILSNRQLALMDYVCKFTQRELTRLTAYRN